MAFSLLLVSILIVYSHCSAKVLSRVFGHKRHCRAFFLMSPHAVRTSQQETHTCLKRGEEGVILISPAGVGFHPGCDISHVAGVTNHIYTQLHGW